MSTTTMTGINNALHIVQSLNSPVRADEDEEDNLIDPEAVDELREIETRMVRLVFGERSLSLVAGSFFPSDKSEAGSGSWEWNETNPDSPLNISSLFRPDKSETDSNPEFSRSNSDNHCFPPDRSDTDSYGSSTPKQFSKSPYSIMSSFPPAMSEIDSPDYCEIIFRNPSIPSYCHFFPPDMSDTDSCGSSTPNHQLSIPSYRSDTDNYGSSTPIQFSIPSIFSKAINGISLDERILRGIKMDKCFEAVDILQSNEVFDLMFHFTDVHEEIYFNGTLRTFKGALGRGGGSPENPSKLLDEYDELAEAMAQLDADSVIHRILTGLRDVVSKTIMPQFLMDPKQKSITERLESNVREAISDLGYRQSGWWTNLMESGDTPPLMESGNVHPLTETVMNYMKWIGDRDTRNLFKIGEDDDQLDDLRNHDVNSLKMKSVASQLLLVVNILESNLEKISKLYADSALRCIFLMNNILYMKQKVKDSGLGGLLGDNWVRTRRAEITQYAKSYLTASWTKVLDCLNDRGTPWSSSSKASTVALQERLKNFNACFEKICRVQTAWVVRDAQLRKELRISILELVIPAYHSFMGRFGNEVESGGHAEQYIKYTADDLENYLSDLFKGIPRVPRTLVPIKPPVRGRAKRRLFLFNKA